MYNAGPNMQPNQGMPQQQGMGQYGVPGMASPGMQGLTPPGMQGMQFDSNGLPIPPGMGYPGMNQGMPIRECPIRECLALPVLCLRSRGSIPASIRRVR